MHAHHVSVADGEAFLSTSRLLFGPITQRFPRGTVPSIPQLVSVNLGACRLSEIKANSHLVLNDRLPEPSREAVGVRAPEMKWASTAVAIVPSGQNGQRLPDRPCGISPARCAVPRPDERMRRHPGVRPACRSSSPRRRE